MAYATQRCGEDVILMQGRGRDRERLRAGSDADAGIDTALGVRWASELCDTDRYANGTIWEVYRVISCD